MEPEMFLDQNTSTESGITGSFIKVRPDETDASWKTQLPEQTRWKLPLLVFLMTTLWWTSAVFVILVIKRTVNGFFPYPFAFTTLTQPTTAFFAAILSQPQLIEFQRHEAFKLVAIGLLQGCEIAFSNKALQYLSVSVRTMLGSLGVLFMMITAWFWKLERLGWIRLTSAFFMIAGGILQGVDERQSGIPVTALSIFYAFGSMTFGAQRWALTQYVLHRSPKHSALGTTSKFHFLARVLPVTGIVCFFLAVTFEPTAFSLDTFCQKELLLSVVTVSLGLILMLYAELKIVSLLSAVAFNILSSIHQIPIVAAGVILQHDRVGLSAFLGFCCCMAGAIIYGFARHVERQQCST